MLAYDVTYPSTVGVVVAGVRTYLGNTFGSVTVQPKLPDAKTARMVTVADDGGLPRDGVLRRRHRLNVWADDPVTAENLGISVADAMRSQLRMLEVAGPVEVTDDIDDVIVVGGKRLYHYLITGVLIVRASNRVEAP